MTALARLLAIGGHRATIGSPHRCITLIAQHHTPSNSELDTNSNNRQFRPPDNLLSEAEQDNHDGQLFQSRNHRVPDRGKSMSTRELDQDGRLGNDGYNRATASTTPAGFREAIFAAAASPAVDPLSTPDTGGLVPLLELPLASSSLDTMTVSRRIRSKAIQRMPVNAREEDSSSDFGGLWRPPLLLGFELDRLNIRLTARLKKYRAKPKFAQIRAQRESLPMNKHRKQVLDLVNNSQFCIITGATGSGKTTQVPQIILDDAIEKGCGANIRILCTQPRRIAAKSTAHRVAFERNEQLRDSVGYQVRFDACLARRQGGTIDFCTIGILVKRLSLGLEPILDRYSHIVIDEVHERFMLLDFLLVSLKKTISKRLAKGKSVPKIILMSASLDNKEQLQEYIADCLPAGNMLSLPTQEACPVLSIPGRMFPVSSAYLNELLPMLRERYGFRLDVMLTDPYGLVAKYIKTETSPDWATQDEILAQEHAAMVPIQLVTVVTAHIATSAIPGAILVFLPGMPEIVAVDEMLRTCGDFLGSDFDDTSKFRIHRLHSTVSATDQAMIFDEIPDGCRRIILSSNIAETSVTVPDVVHVIDSGKIREKWYDQSKRIQSFKTTWQAKPNAMQREGRAGRVREGHYYGLYARDRREALDDACMPEILRGDLMETCLSLKAQGFEDKITDLLAESITPPSPTAVEAAIKSLKDIDALAANGGITRLGRVLASLPVHPYFGKLILLGVAFRCLDSMIVLGAMSTQDSVLTVSSNAREAARLAHQRFHTGRSDHLTQLKAFNHLRQLEQTSREEANLFALENHLNFAAYTNIMMAAVQIEESLIEHKVIPNMLQIRKGFSNFGGIELNVNSSNEQLLKGVLLKGLYPNLAIKAKGPGSYSISTAASGAQPVLIYKRSVNNFKLARDNSVILRKNSLFVYDQLHSTRTGRMISGNTHLESPLVLALFGGPLDRPGSGDMGVKQQTMSMDGGGEFGVRYRIECAAELWPRSTTPAETLVQFREHMDVVINDAFRRLLASRGLRPGPETHYLDDVVTRIATLMKQEQARLG